MHVQPTVQDDQIHGREATVGMYKLPGSRHGTPIQQIQLPNQARWPSGLRRAVKASNSDPSLDLQVSASLIWRGFESHPCQFFSYFGNAQSKLTLQRQPASPRLFWVVVYVVCCIFRQFEKLETETHYFSIAVGVPSQFTGQIYFYIPDTSHRLSGDGIYLRPVTLPSFSTGLATLNNQFLHFSEKSY
ncbi:hypothetical protein BJX76DRAFT_6796 [Aspergillus varians]